jgi:hypothetical protein
MALREPFPADPFRSGNRFRDEVADTDPAPEGISFRDNPVSMDTDEAPPRKWIPSRPARKLPHAHEGTGGGQLTQEHTAMFLEGEPIGLSSEMGIVSARWVPDSERLEVSFNTGKGKWYSPVAWYEAQDFITARSKGVWLWDHVLVRGKGNKGKTKKASGDL